MTDKKRRPGRPPSLRDPVSQNVTLEREHKEHCEKFDIGVSAHIRHLIEEDMKKPQ